MSTTNTRFTHALILHLLATILIPLCYGESSLRISSKYVSLLFLYGPSNSHLYHKIISIGIIFSLFSLHTLAWACILQFKLSIMLVSLNSQPCLCIFQPNSCYYLSYVSSTSQRIYKLELLHKLTTEYTLHSRVKLSITQNLNCCFPKILL